jgi:hypothetical protein
MAKQFDSETIGAKLGTLESRYGTIGTHKYFEGNNPKILKGNEGDIFMQIQYLEPNLNE